MAHIVTLALPVDFNRWLWNQLLNKFCGSARPDSGVKCYAGVERDRY